MPVPKQKAGSYPHSHPSFRQHEDLGCGSVHVPPVAALSSFRTTCAPSCGFYKDREVIVTE